MQWPFLPKWVICPQRKWCNSFFSIKEHKVKTGINLICSKTHFLMLSSIEHSSYAPLQCPQLQYSFLEPLGKPGLLLVLQTYGSMFSFSIKNYGEFSAADVNTGNKHCSFFKKLSEVSNVTWNSWQQEGNPSTLNAYGLFCSPNSCQALDPWGLNRGLWPQTWTLGKLSPPTYKEHLWAEHEDLIRKCVQEVGQLHTKKYTLILT